MRVVSAIVEPHEVVELMVIVGFTVSIVKVYVFDTVLSFPAASLDVPAATDTTTVPSDEPLTASNVYVVPLPAKLLATGEPLLAVPVTVMSPTAKSDTDFENVTV